MRVPACIAVDDLYARLKERGFIIYRCKGALGAHYVQISTWASCPTPPSTPSGRGGRRGGRGPRGHRERKIAGACARCSCFPSLRNGLAGRGSESFARIRGLTYDRAQQQASHEQPMPTISDGFKAVRAIRRVTTSTGR